MRVLRFLWSLEKNRKMFRKLFPPAMYGAFIDVGNYNKNLNSYNAVLHSYHSLNLKEIENVLCEGHEMMVAESAEKIIGGYLVLELLGQGAFGSVYAAHKGENK